MDRYKEGYNDCNREWKKKIEETIKNKEKQLQKLKNELTGRKTNSVNKNMLYAEIIVLEDLLKKGERDV